eukprot:2956912-Rhodomonas_salina.1
MTDETGDSNHPRWLSARRIPTGLRQRTRNPGTGGSVGLARKAVGPGRIHALAHATESGEHVHLQLDL